jgi:hypothetical protein
MTPCENPFWPMGLCYLWMIDDRFSFSFAILSSTFNIPRFRALMALY